MWLCNHLSLISLTDSYYILYYSYLQTSYILYYTYLQTYRLLCGMNLPIKLNHFKTWTLTKANVLSAFRQVVSSLLKLKQLLTIRSCSPLLLLQFQYDHSLLISSVKVLLELSTTEISWWQYAVYTVLSGVVLSIFQSKLFLLHNRGNASF